MSVRTRLRHWLGWHRRRLLRPRAAATAAPLESAAATAATAATGAPAAAAPRNPEVAALADRYEERVREFYAYLPADVKELFVGDALYHRVRYLDMLAQPFGDEVVELGSDKPFITHYLRALNPRSRVHTISIDIPYSPYPIIRIDIESEPFPFADGSVSDVVFTEVLEHLFRDPAWTIAEIARVLKVGGRLFLTTPNACGYDILVNLLSQVNPNGRNQFYKSIESGHPHLWTADECRTLLEAHGFAMESLTTVDYYDMPLPAAVRTFLAANSVDPARNGQVLRIVAEKRRTVPGVVYPESLFPQGQGVRLGGALRKWAERELKEGGGR